MVDFKKTKWLLLCVSIVIATVASLSVHVVLFDVFRVPHPDTAAVPAGPLFLNELFSIAALIVAYQLSMPWFSKWSAASRVLILTLVYTMLGECLRAFIMDVVVSHDWIYCFVENLARPLESLVACAMVVTLATHLKAWWQVSAAAIGIAVVMMFLVNPVVGKAFDTIVASIEYLDTGNIYNPPYGWQVDVPSYLTFIEPVIASMWIAGLCWKSLSVGPMTRLCQFSLLIMALKGSIIPTAIYSFYQDMPLGEAFLSEAQFGIEIMVMAILCAVGWSVSRPRLER